MTSKPTPSQPIARYDSLVIGGGPVGLVSAIALAQTGLRVGLVAAPHKPAGERADTRTAALFAGSITLLQRIGVWEDLKGQCARLSAIRLIDDTGGILRAPEVVFRAAELGLDAFGYNVPQEPLLAALRGAAQRLAPGLDFIETEGARRFGVANDGVTVELADGRPLWARLVVAADGRRSLTREAAGIGIDEHAYEQSAVTCLFQHQRPHDDISTELHRRAGPLTVVPMAGRMSSLVWVERSDVAARLAGLDDDSFRRTLTANLQGLLGTISTLSSRSVFPLSAVSARAMGRNRVVLVGEAAHVMPPIGAQGLNLSLRDAATLADLVAEAAGMGRDIGGPEVIARYDAARRSDVGMRSRAVDALNRSLLSDLVPVQLLRGAGLQAARAFPPLRKLMMQAGMQPFGELPSLMQDEGGEARSVVAGQGRVS